MFVDLFFYFFQFLNIYLKIYIEKIISFFFLYFISKLNTQNIKYFSLFKIGNILNSLSFVIRFSFIE